MDTVGATNKIGGIQKSSTFVQGTVRTIRISKIGHRIPYRSFEFSWKNLVGLCIIHTHFYYSTYVEL